MSIRDPGQSVTIVFLFCLFWNGAALVDRCPLEISLASKRKSHLRR